MLLNMIFPLTVWSLKESYHHKIGEFVQDTVTWRTVARSAS
jgi:hypothetical protein